MTDQAEPSYSELVRVRIGDVEKNMGRALAEISDDVQILDEETRTPDGRLREETRVGGRPVKPKTTVAKKAAAKKAAAKKTAAKKAAAAPAEQAVTPSADEKKEQDQ